MHFSHTVSLAILASTVAVSAYQVTFPGKGDTWSNSGDQDVKWTKVDTDKPGFAIFLTNTNRDELTTNNLLLKANVDGSSGSTSASLPQDSNLCGRTFRLNLCLNDKDPETILAQSQEFIIGGSKCGGVITTTASSSTTATTTRTTTTSQSQTATSAVPGTSTSVATSGTSTGARSGPSVQSNNNIANKAREAGPINLHMIGLCASFALIGAFLV
ncbi:hypothetical protein V5O48_016829 [Marasmius crinis-equi]|uniref:Yeast cell wall synthesis Kre9/Knh1-like N-terminal domain-containing protein n=1 Tax=Marasmius crinis-equi TaxID=585013 RepID=A0ABR3EQU7_9AGAR